MKGDQTEVEPIKISSRLSAVTGRKHVRRDVWLDDLDAKMMVLQIIEVEKKLGRDHAGALLCATQIPIPPKCKCLPYNLTAFRPQSDI